MAETLWDGKSEEELWKIYRKGRDQKLRDFFVRQYAPLVKYVAGKIAMGMPQNVEFDDLVGFGVFGLFDAIDKFDPGKHVKFKTYAVTRIRGAIFDELRTIDWVPRSVRQKAREVEDTVRRLESSLGRAASDEEIAAGMEMDLKEFQQMMLKISGTSMLSLHDIWYTGEDNDKISIAESIESPGKPEPGYHRRKGRDQTRHCRRDQGASGKGKEGSRALLLRGPDPQGDRRGPGCHGEPGFAASHEGGDASPCEAHQLQERNRVKECAERRGPADPQCPPTPPSAAARASSTSDSSRSTCAGSPRRTRRTAPSPWKRTPCPKP